MFLAFEPQESGVYFPSQGQDHFKASKLLIRVRKIALHDEHVASKIAKAPLHRQLDTPMSSTRTLAPRSTIYAEP